MDTIEPGQPVEPCVLTYAQAAEGRYLEVQY